MQREGDEFGTPVAIHIDKSQPMQRGLSADARGRPQAIRTRVPQPMQGAAALGIAGFPIAGERNIQAPIAVDIVNRDGDVILGRHPVGDDVLLPGGILIPGHLRVMHRHDVRQFVAIDIGHLDGVDDAILFVDFLSTKVLGGEGYAKYE